MANKLGCTTLYKADVKVEYLLLETNMIFNPDNSAKQAGLLVQISISHTQYTQMIPKISLT